MKQSKIHVDRKLKLLLFDIDGTMLLAGGAATNAINRAFEKVFGVANAMNGVKADGKTDPIILREMFSNTLGRDFLPHEAERVFREYEPLLGEELAASKRFKVLPGVPDLLKAASERKDLVLGVASGNIEKGAWIKLRHAGLDKYFKFGGFGSDSENRERLIRFAIARAKAHLNRYDIFDAVFVIGDTPLDITHGKAAGAITVAVATGSYSVEDLSKFSPDYVFEDFSDYRAALQVFEWKNPLDE
ncbi:MAG: HAD family hydrolase [Deltaproteobacteria bacterium]